MYVLKHWPGTAHCICVWSLILCPSFESFLPVCACACVCTCVLVCVCVLQIPDVVFVTSRLGPASHPILHACEHVILRSQQTFSFAEVMQCCQSYSVANFNSSAIFKLMTNALEPALATEDVKEVCSACWLQQICMYNVFLPAGQVPDSMKWE